MRVSPVPERDVVFYSSGGCPTCGPTMPLAFVRSTASGRVFVFCHSCEVALPHPRDADPFVRFYPLGALAPGGIAFATEAEIRRAGMGPWIERRHDDLDWLYRRFIPES